MCDYCGCRELEPVGRLSDEHETIGTLETAVRVALRAGDMTAARARFDGLADMLVVHLEREETGLFAELRLDGAFEAVLDGLVAEHVQMRAALGVMAALTSDDDWAAAARQVLHDLDRHIWAEEYDLFPASIVGVTDEGWARLTERDHELDHVHGVPHGHMHLHDQDHVHDEAA
jgi:DUF438 domain-containing protein